MQNRINLTFYIGFETINSDSYEFEQTIIDTACSIAGGCNVSNLQGYWRQDAAVKDQYKFRYTGPLCKEYCLKVEVLVLENATEYVYSRMKKIIAVSAKRLLPGTQWVHVTRQEVKAMHFDINKVN